MKAILEYNLPEDQEQFDEAINGGRWQHVAWSLDQWLRSQTKYAPDSQNSEYTNALYIAREQLHEYLNEEGLKL